MRTADRGLLEEWKFFLDTLDPQTAGELSRRISVMHKRRTAQIGSEAAEFAMFVCGGDVLPMPKMKGNI